MAPADAGLPETLQRYIDLEKSIRRSEILAILNILIEKFGILDPDITQQMTALLLNRWQSFDD